LIKGYVDDPRNTDNAWMETVACLFHDGEGNQIGQFKLKAGDDAKALQWMDIDDDLNLYASHKMFLMLAAKHLRAHWRQINPD
jgi:ADP-ribose pyrophosphatase